MELTRMGVGAGVAAALVAVLTGCEQQAAGTAAQLTAPGSPAASPAAATPVAGYRVSGERHQRLPEDAATPQDRLVHPEAAPSRPRAARPAPTPGPPPRVAPPSPRADATMGLCDAAEYYGQWPPGSEQERLCRSVYGP
jgi:hypothetical protein